MDGTEILLLIAFLGLAIHGMKKSWRWFDTGDKVKGAAQSCLTIWLKR
jgi:hypothetical protein